MAPVSRSTPCSALWAKCVRPTFIFATFASGSCGDCHASFDVFLFFRDRSKRANSARVGLSIPEASASRRTNASYDSPVSRGAPIQPGRNRRRLHLRRRGHARVRRYGAEPGAPPEERVAVDRVGVGEPEGGHLASNVEGLSIYAPRVGGPDDGFLVASSQGNHTYYRLRPRPAARLPRDLPCGRSGGGRRRRGHRRPARGVGSGRSALSDGPARRPGWDQTWPRTRGSTRTSSSFRGRTCSTPSTSPFPKVLSESEASVCHGHHASSAPCASASHCARAL